MAPRDRKKREKAARRQQILDAARGLLLEKGLHGTSINQVAKRAEMGVATIYFYYQNKAELFAALQQEGLALLHAQLIDNCAGASTAAEKLATAADTYYRFRTVHASYFDIINYFLSTPEVMFNAPLKKQVDQGSRRLLDLIMEIIAHGMAQQEFRTVDVQRHAVAFWGLLHGLIQLQKLEATALDGIAHQSYYRYGVTQAIRNLTL